MVLNWAQIGEAQKALRLEQEAHAVTRKKLEELAGQGQGQ